MLQIKTLEICVMQYLVYLVYLVHINQIPDGGLLKYDYIAFIIIYQ